MDLNIFTVPSSEREIFDPVNAWSGDPARVYVATYRSGPVAVFQIGYDPSSGKSYVRNLARPGLAWSAWTEVAPAPPPTAPVVVANAMVNANKGVLLHFDQYVDPSSVPPTSAFTVTRDGDPREVVGVRISGTDVLLDIATQAGSGTIVCAYDGDELKGLDGGIPVAPFSINITVPIGASAP